ncbi:MAG: DUF4007 family protein [Kiritimatiellae bacterium]|nr:DUF4007 family protein [Kiritimatiellia bacterium]
MSKSMLLPRNFHRSFKPERQYINAMLQFAAAGKSGDYQSIAADTGIPMGTSTGKVPAILDYCRGMGLVRLQGAERSAKKQPALTPFGRIVFLEDPFLKEKITQWVAHLNLCSPLFGAEVWYQTFFKESQSLGYRFSRTDLDTNLSLALGVDPGGLIGPLIGIYADEASFSNCGAITEQCGNLTRHPAPSEDVFGFGYGAWLLQLMMDHFPKQGQISTTELDTVSGWRAIPGWDAFMAKNILELIERKGLIEVDRHMNPWLLRAKINLDLAWPKIFNDLI